MPAVQLPPPLAQRVLATLVRPATKPSSDIDMWQVVSGIANLLSDCGLQAVVQTVAGDGKPYLLHTGW